MANIESKNLLVAVKAYSRGNALPLDASELYDSFAAAQAYAKEANAYAGQTIKVLEDGKYKSYVLQPSENGLTLEEVGAVQPEDLHSYVQTVSELPETGEVNTIYVISKNVKEVIDGVETDTVIDTKWEGFIWVPNDNNGTYEKVFEDVVPELQNVFTTLDTKAPINNPVFLGTVKIGDDEVAVKSYVEALIANLHSGVPEILNSDSPIPLDSYKAGQMWRVTEAGLYVGQKCEIGDLVICLKSYNEGTATTSDFMVVQANVDGAVTSSETVVTDGHVVVFDGVTGKVIKSSDISLNDLNDAVRKKHEHTNINQLNSFTKTETELLSDAQSTANSLVTDAKTELNKKIEDGLALVYNKTEIDDKVNTINDNINSKLSVDDFNTKLGGIADGTTIKEYVDANVGSLDDGTTVVDYIDTKLGNITDENNEAQSVKDYVDTGLSKKANSADTLAGYGIGNAYTKDEVDNKVSTDINAAKTDLQNEINKKADNSSVTDLTNKVNTLVGTDTDKSVRTIANEEIAAKLIPSDAKEALDTLGEIAAWIQSHPDDAAAMNESILAIQKQLSNIAAGEGTVKQYVDNAIAGIDFSPYATTQNLSDGIAEAKEHAMNLVAAALTVVRFE